MKAVILAGGFGTRLSEETYDKPKPMVEIGGMPILWHIMKIYSSHGINEFIICLGYKGYSIKEYFSNYFLHRSDVTINLEDNSLKVHQVKAEPWKVTLVDTGELTQTGGRLKRVGPYLDDDTFCFTYGDGVTDLNIKDTISFHNSNNNLATITAVQPDGRFGSLKIDDEKIVEEFIEKPVGDGGWVSGGFFVLSPKVLDYISGDEIKWEEEPLRRLAEEKQLSAFKHSGFWRPMDTLRDKSYLESLWKENKAPWKSW